MDNSILKKLLIEYDRKRTEAEKNADMKMHQFFDRFPELADISNKINIAGVDYAKSILSSNTALSDKLALNIKNLNFEKDEILKKLNLSNKDFLPKYECLNCNDTGYVTVNNKTDMCTCLKQRLINSLYNKSNIYNLDKENFSTFNINVYSDKVDKEKYNSDISPRENIKKIKNIVNTFIKNFDAVDEKNLFFTGNSGLGKTFLSNCIAKELIEKEKTVIYQTAPIMLDSILDYKFGKSNISKDYYDDLINCDLLIIDDLGTESKNNFKLSELFNIINTRLLNQAHRSLKTIISTNLTLQNIFSAYDERIVSRIVGYYNICKFFGDDIRFHK